ncbi:MAG: NADH-quinone oxidoreductase subunit J [Sphingobacteriales bacterium UTBCD1]|jgi:NADH-quinone oxidoreductase subunit J|nr:MAG: NADH-quinone oxidoreductase subunit J [Sphingobacteriales bacterium UTBCD1]
MQIIFYIAALVAIVSTAMVITRKNAVHALLYLIVSLLAVSVIFFIMGAPFVAALEVIVYAGAIMILIIFAIMMLNLGQASEKREKEWLKPRTWIGPGILAAILLAELIYTLNSFSPSAHEQAIIDAKDVGMSLFSTYALGVELAAMMLMAGIVGAYHIGHEKQKEYHRYLQKEEKL